MHYPNLPTTALDQREPLQKTKGLFLDCQIKIFFNSNIYTLIPAYFYQALYYLHLSHSLAGHQITHSTFVFCLFCLYFFLLGALNQRPQKVI